MRDENSFSAHVHREKERRSCLESRIQQAVQNEQEIQTERERFEQDYSGVDPKDIFTPIEAVDCMEFLQLMQSANYPKAVLVGNTDTMVSQLSPRRRWLEAIAGVPRQKAKKEFLGPVWKAYKVAQAVAEGKKFRTTYSGYRGRPTADGQSIYLCEDGRIRTSNGFRIQPGHYTLEVGNMVVDKRIPLESGSGAYMYDVVDAHFERISLRGKLTQIAIESGV